MKRIILLCTFSLMQTVLFAQCLETRKQYLFSKGEKIDYPPIYFMHLNWNVVVDDAVPDGNYYTLGGKFIFEYNNNPKRDTIDISIYPGDFEMDLTDYEFIMKQENIKVIYLILHYTENCCFDGNISRSRRYEIPFYSKDLLDFRYVVLYIYNTDKKENKPYYYPLPGKTYNYQFMYPDCGVVFINKKLTKKQKNFCKYYDYFDRDGNVVKFKERIKKRKEEKIEIKESKKLQKEWEEELKELIKRRKLQKELEKENK